MDAKIKDLSLITLFMASSVEKYIHVVEDDVEIHRLDSAVMQGFHRIESSSGNEALLKYKKNLAP